MESAVAFRESRTQERVDALTRAGFVAIDPLVGLLADLTNYRSTLEEWQQSTEVVDSFRAKLLAACEDGIDDIHMWRSAATVARLLQRSPETIRDWCRKGKIRHRGNGDTGYKVHVTSALEYNASLNR